MSDIWEARLDRERRARKAAEQLLEEKSRELYLRNEELAQLTRGLEEEVSARTRELAVALAAEREMNQRQRSFVSIVSHEFRTPLSIIDGAAQRLARNAGSADAEDIRERSRRIRAAVAHLINLAERMLSSARLEEGRMQVNRAPVAIVDLVEMACARQRSLSTSHEINTDLAAAAATLELDPHLIDQVITNLLSNAVKYSGASCRIEVIGRINAGHVEISVRDYGVGIPEEEMGQLFTRFFRASTAKGVPGTGIGLHLVKQLVELHDGTICAERAVDRGCIFTVSLPLSRGAPTVERAAVPAGGRAA